MPTKKFLSVLKLLIFSLNIYIRLRFVSGFSSEEIYEGNHIVYRPVSTLRRFLLITQIEIKFELYHPLIMKFSIIEIATVCCKSRAHKTGLIPRLALK